MANYIKVSPVVAKVLGLRDIRNKTKDGNYLLWQADVLGLPGDNIVARAAYCGGAVLTPNVAKDEIDGIENPIKVEVTEEFINQYGMEEIVTESTISEMPVNEEEGNV